MITWSFDKSKEQISEIIIKNGKENFDKYTYNETGFFTQLNRKVRLNETLNKEELKVLNALKLAINNCKTSKELIVYRGLNLNDIIIQEKFKQLNQTDLMKGITSTSLDYSIAKEYSKKGKYGVLLKINVPANFNCFPILDNSAHAEESEVIFYNLKYQVIDFHYEGNLLISEIIILM